LLIVTVTFFLTMVSEIQDPTIILSDIFNIVPSVQAQKLIDTVMVFSTLISEVQAQESNATVTVLA